MNWISISDDTPNGDDDVLVSDGWYMAIAHLDRYAYGIKFLPSNVDVSYDMASAGLDFTPTHWAPLPNLPKRNND